MLPCPESISGAEVSALFIKACLSCAACCLSISYMYSSPLFSTANCASMIYESTYNCISIPNAFWISNLAPQHQRDKAGSARKANIRTFQRAVQLSLVPVISITIPLFFLGTRTPKINVIDLIAICSLELWERWSEVGEDGWSVAVSQQEKRLRPLYSGVNMGFLINGCWVTWLHFPRPPSLI